MGQVLGPSFWRGQQIFFDSFFFSKNNVLGWKGGVWQDSEEWKECEIMDCVSLNIAVVRF